MRVLIRRSSRYCLLFLLVLVLTACAAGRSAYKRGEEALQQDNYDLAVTSFMTALQQNPESQNYQLKLDAARVRAAQQHKHRADRLLAQQNYQGALQEYQIASELDGSFYAASDGAKMAGRYLQAQRMTAEAEDLWKLRKRQQAKQVVERALNLVADYQPALKLLQQMKNAQFPLIDGVELEVTSTKPITLNFTDAKLPDVFDILTKLSGINFILDEDVRGNNTTLYLEKATFAQSLELLLRMNKLDKKVLNSKTIILFPKSRDKQKQFEDQIIQTFYLSNIDAKKAVNLLRTMLQVRKIYVHEELNAIIIRDNPEVIRLAQKILEANDRANAEVVFDLELIEVSHNDLRNLGVKLSNYSVSVGAAANGASSIISSGLEPGASTDGLGRLDNRQLDLFYTLPTATFRFVKTQGQAEILASPKIRVKNKEKAKVHIGSREPVITVTTSGTDNVSENVQYVDVGVKLDVEPTIQLDNTIITKVGLEVSNVSDRQTTTNGTAVITISTTNANTALTLKDGEQTVIGGLLRDDKSVSKNKIPLLGDIPILGELFNATDKTANKREIILSITPHIVKSLTLPETDAASIWSGGEDDLKYGRNFGSFADEYVTAQQGLAPEVDMSAEPPGLEGQEVPPAMVPGESSGQVPAPIAPVPQPVEPVPGEPSMNESMLPPSEPAAGTNVEQVVMAQNQQLEDVSTPRVFTQGSQLAKVGDSLTMTFSVADMKDLFSAPLYVQYDPRFFKFLDAREGDFLKQGGAQTVFTHTTFDNSGRIIVGLKQGAGSSGASGDGNLFSMDFQAISPGVSEIAPTRTNFRNPQGQRMQTESMGLSIEVTQ